MKIRKRAIFVLTTALMMTAPAAADARTKATAPKKVNPTVSAWTCGAGSCYGEFDGTVDLIESGTVWQVKGELSAGSYCAGKDFELWVRGTRKNGSKWSETKVADVACRHLEGKGKQVSGTGDWRYWEDKSVDVRVCLFRGIIPGERACGSWIIVDMSDWRP